MTLAPAYGRDYNSRKAVLKDWDEGKDFIEVMTDRPINKAQAILLNVDVTIRYARLTKAIVVA